MSLKQLIVRLIALEENHRALVENCDVEIVFIHEKDGQEAVAVLARNGKEYTLEELASLVETRENSVFVPVASPNDYNDGSLAKRISDDVSAAWMYEGTAEDLRLENRLYGELVAQAEQEGVTLSEMRDRWKSERQDDYAELMRLSALRQKVGQAQARCRERDEAHEPFLKAMFRRLWDHKLAS